nr:endonuclease/exonuclease/phosphatase family protein [Pantoea sp. 1.19]
MRLNILTLNIHKGFTSFNRRFMLPDLREAIRGTGADLVLLQEVTGSQLLHGTPPDGWPTASHLAFLADSVWPQYAYGRNAVYPEGDHGNAVLSRFPIHRVHNRDISTPGSEKRGVLHCEIALPDDRPPLQVMCIHLGLRAAQRRAQLAQLCELIAALPPASPLVVGGDFNDWQQYATRKLQQCANLKEVFSQHAGRPARTFPAWLPLLRLDRLYVRNAAFSRPLSLPRQPWSQLSDHAPLAVEIQL